MRVRPAQRSGGAAGQLQRSLRHGSFLTALAIILAVALAACGGSSTANVKNAATSYGTTLYGALPAAGTPTSGGDVTVGQISGQTPDFIFPLYDCTHQTTVDENFINHLYVPLYNGPTGARPENNYQLSAATGAPVASNGGKTYTITLRPDLKWSNGVSVDANDVLFYIDLVKQAVKEDASNWCSYIPGQFPDDLTSAKVTGKYTLVLNLTKAFNPGYFLSSQIGAFTPMPSTAWNIASANGPHLNFTNPANAKKIYDYLFKQGSDVSQFVSDALWKDIDGPWKLKDYSVTNASYDMVPNPSYTGPVKPKLAEVSYVTYTSIISQLDALKSGALDVGGLDSTQLSQAPGLKRQGYSVYGSPSWGFYDALINFHDATGSFGAVVKNLYAREALYDLEDQPAIAKGIYKGAAVPQYGPVPSEPQSPYTPADAVTPPYPYSPKAAVALLKAHGWKVVPGGKSTCVHPGTAANECGAGVPKGSGFGGVWLNVPEAVAPSFVLSSEAIVSEDKAAAGIDFTFKTITFDVAQEYNDQGPQGKQLENSWAINNTGGFSISYYPTSEGLFNTGGAFNEGDYSDPTADKLMNASVYSTNSKAVNAEASYLAKSPPVLFLPDPDQVFAVSKRVGGTADSFLQLGYQIDAPQYWYVKKSATS